MLGNWLLLDFLEAMSKEASVRVKSHQNLMKELLEAAKRSETTLNDFIESKAEQVLSVSPLNNIYVSGYFAFSFIVDIA